MSLLKVNRLQRDGGASSQNRNLRWNTQELRCCHPSQRETLSTVEVAIICHEAHANGLEALNNSPLKNRYPCLTASKRSCCITRQLQHFRRFSTLCRLLVLLLSLVSLSTGFHFSTPGSVTNNVDGWRSIGKVGLCHPAGSKVKHTVAIQSKSSLVAEEGKQQKTITVTDKNGNELSVGNIVRVTKATKAFHLPANARGVYNDKKEFVPSGDDQPHMVVPIGMCGVITKVYVEANLSANFKIQVKFTPGDDINKEGFDPPVPFKMHFGSSEVECTPT